MSQKGRSKEPQPAGGQMEEYMRRLGGGYFMQQKRVYEDWMEKEGIPVYEAFAGIEDITELPRRPWARMGGLGTFIELEGTKQARKLNYVAEIPTNGALEPEKHLYDELIYILRGRGLSEIWYEGKPKHTFEWGVGSLFAIPLNASHRLVNGGREPVLLFAQNNAPLMMNSVRDTEFIFNCDYNFTTRYRDLNVPDRYTGQADYFNVSEKPSTKGDKDGRVPAWETNFVPDIRTAFVGDHVSTGKVEGGRQTEIRMGGWMTLHTSEWPEGKYHKGHFHGPGAILLGLRGSGYVLIWHGQYGIHPYQDGHGDKVKKIYWKENSIYSPPNEWFHQHFNTGKGWARHLADTGGGLGVEMPTLLPTVGEYGGLHVWVGDGYRKSWMKAIDYENEDPYIRQDFKEELKKNGIKFAMEPVTYRTKPFQSDL